MQTTAVSTIKIHLSNISEDIWQFIQTLSPQEQQQEIQENAYLAERDLIANVAAANKSFLLFLSPIPIEKSYQDYIREIFPGTPFKVIHPQQHTGKTAYDVMQDIACTHHIIQSIKKFSHIFFTAHCVSSDTWKFKQFLESLHPSVYTPEFPSRKSFFTDPNFGSKVWFRKISRSLETHKCKLPRGAVCYSKKSAVTHALSLSQSGHGIVFKPAKAHSGMGIVFIPKEKMPLTRAERKMHFQRVLSSARYWKKFPIIVEMYIPHLPSSPEAFPSIEYFIDSIGNIHCSYISTMFMTPTGNFQGARVSPHITSLPHIRLLDSFGHSLGKKLTQLGYRGYFDIDGIVSLDGKVYISESNARRTGGTHIPFLGQRLFGNKWSSLEIISRSFVPLPKPNTIRNFMQLRQCFEKILITKKHPYGVVLTSARLFRLGFFGYVIFAPSKQKALYYEDTIHNILSHDGDKHEDAPSS